MLFNSFQFAIFFIIVYFLYLKSIHRRQNSILLVASYIFYAYWDWRFLPLLIISTVIDYNCGFKIYDSPDIYRKKLFLLLSICANLLILGTFKYFNFFVGSFQNLLCSFGFSTNISSLNIILPLGISFYTFQSMSYTIDIYRKKIKPTINFWDFALFVSFFPQLIAGPIERATHLLPQIILPRKISLDKFYEGCYLIFWGLFMKIVIADNLAAMVDPIFLANPPYDGLKVLLALYLFAFQIFCDFAGYSNIARGVGKCMGFDIVINFNLPYFASNPREFWQRWHISLSSWVRDYLYKYLKKRKNNRLHLFGSILITMGIMGLWHGAEWKFLFWGLYHGIIVSIYRLCSSGFNKIDFLKQSFIRKVWRFCGGITLFHLVCFGWLLFRANSMEQIFSMTESLFLNFNFKSINDISYMVYKAGFFLWVLIVVQIFQYWKKDLMVVYKSNVIIKALFYYICFQMMLGYGGMGEEFVYFIF